MINKDTTSAKIHFTNILSVALVTVALNSAEFTGDFALTVWRRKIFLVISLAKARCFYADPFK